MLLQIYRQPLQNIAAIMLVAVLLWAGLMYVLQRHQKLIRGVNIILSIISLGGILYITLCRGESGNSELILAPFHSFVEAKTQPEMYRSMLMNIFLFLPFGLTLPYALPGKWRYKALIAIILAFLCSSLVEAAQYIFALGRAETDDVIMNTAGAALGTVAYLLFCAACWLHEKKPERR